MSKVTIELDLNTKMGADFMKLYISAHHLTQPEGNPVKAEQIEMPLPAAQPSPVDIVSQPLTPPASKPRGRKPKADPASFEVPEGMSPAIDTSAPVPDDPLPPEMQPTPAPSTNDAPTFEQVQAAAQTFYEQMGAEGFRNLLFNKFQVRRWRDVPENRWAELLKDMGAV